MSKIPPELLAEILIDPFYKKCCVKDDTCDGRIEFHHNLIYGGKQYQAKFCILAVCQHHHRHADDKELKEKLNWIMLSRATLQEIIKISKAINYQQMFIYLTKKFGIWSK